MMKCLHKQIFPKWFDYHKYFISDEENQLLTKLRIALEDQQCHSWGYLDPFSEHYDSPKFLQQIVGYSDDQSTKLELTSVFDVPRLISEVINTVDNYHRDVVNNNNGDASKIVEILINDYVSPVFLVSRLNR